MPPVPGPMTPSMNESLPVKSIVPSQSTKKIPTAVLFFIDSRNRSDTFKPVNLYETFTKVLVSVNTFSSQ